MTIYKHVFKKKFVPDTFCVDRSAFIFFFYYRPEKEVSGDQEIPQSHTAYQDQA